MMGAISKSSSDNGLHTEYVVMGDEPGKGDGWLLFKMRDFLMNKKGIHSAVFY